MIASAEGKSLVGGCGVILPRKFLNLEAPKRYFHHLSWDMSPKNRPRIRKWQTIAITITKMTESTEKKSIYRLNLFDATGPGGAAAPLPPPLAIALEWRWLLLFPTKMTLVTHKHCLVLRKSRTRSRHRGQRSLFSPMPIKNIPPTSIAFLQTTHLDMHSLCFFLKQGLFERSFEKRVIVEKIAHRRTSESTLPCTGTR